MHSPRELGRRFFAPDGRWRWDEFAIFVLVLQMTMRKLFDNMPTTSVGASLPALTFVWLLEFLFFISVAMLLSVTAAVGVAWGYRQLKTLGRALLGRVTRPR